MFKSIYIAPSFARVSNRNFEIAPSLCNASTSLNKFKHVLKCFTRGVYQHICNRFKSVQIQIFRKNPALVLNKSEHDSKGIAPSFEREPNR